MRIEGRSSGDTEAKRPERLIRARRRRTAGLVQLVFVAIGIGLGVLLGRIRSGPMITTSRAVEVLGTVGFGVVGLVSVIFSLLFLVVQSSNTTFTPRLRVFEDDPWIWRTYALAFGLFAFSMSAFMAIGDAHGVSVVVPIVAFATTLAVIGLVRRILVGAYDALQLNSVIDRVFGAGRSVITDLYPHRWATDDTEGEVAPGPPGRPVRWAAPQTTLQQLDLRRLVTEAERAESVVHFEVRVGTTMREAATIATVQGVLADDVVTSSCVTGTNRTFNQDPLLAFRLLADIGLRALSPAVNDPATAVQALDAVIGLLALVAPRDLAVGSVAARGGTVRVRINMPAWPDFVSEGLDDLIAAAGSSPMMVRRARATLCELADATPPPRRAEIEARLRALAPAGAR